MSSSSIVLTRFLALSVLAGCALVSHPAAAQDGAAPPVTPGEPVNPWQSAPPSGTQAPPLSPPAPSESQPEPAKESETTPGVEPVNPSPALIFLQSRREAAAAREGPRADREVEEPDDGKLRHHQDHLIGLIGARVARITSPGLDPFGDSDELAQLSLGVGRTVVSSGNFSLAGLFLYDVGGRSGQARGAKSDLTVHRLTLGIEGRLHFIRQYFVFARVAPGALHSIAGLEDHTVDVDNRGARNWVFATDLSVGAMLELSGWAGSSRRRGPNAWITLDGGYGFAAESELVMVADGGQGPQRGAPVDLGPLGLGGPFMRGAVVLTY